MVHVQNYFMGERVVKSACGDLCRSRFKRTSVNGIVGIFGSDSDFNCILIEHLASCLDDKDFSRN